MSTYSALAFECGQQFLHPLGGQDLGGVGRDGAAGEHLEIGTCVSCKGSSLRVPPRRAQLRYPGGQPRVVREPEDLVEVGPRRSASTSTVGEPAAAKVIARLARSSTCRHQGWSKSRAAYGRACPDWRTVYSCAASVRLRSRRLGSVISHQPGPSLSYPLPSLPSMSSTLFELLVLSLVVLVDMWT